MTSGDPARSGAWQAVVFDFDGLILDTETPLFEAWRRIYDHHGVEPITLGEWSTSLGLQESDPLRLDPFIRLAERADRPITREEVQEFRRQHRDELLAIEVLRPGVEQLLDQADALGIPVGIATSSPRDWIEDNLLPRGALHRFAVVASVGDGLAGKPDPATYLAACRGLGADPARSLALEDSPNGIRAAKAAGLTCIAVPNTVSEGLDLSLADVVTDSLERLDLALGAAQLPGVAGVAGPS